MGDMAGPFLLANVLTFILSSLAVIPKNVAGKWDAIVDMSSPHGASVNNNLQRNLTYVAFSSVGDAAHLMHHLDPNTLLDMLDIKEAYRLILVHPTTGFSKASAGKILFSLTASFSLASHLRQPFSTY